ncbi:3-oxoacid CoA-transferase subunit B [Herbiconiux sp. CPCC 203407]|uniref:3-oxoacid CoA-transferase subunit B n=1 Tax=Herbiconiux oxytropis TaxID=2970915 RepID=A0AA42BSB5_9MICO|nr:3-oxoacid CoA-transferase subunit B [Herbiconiux oxytropis]MCS5721565.1 3-oxoacid CoA-transferase subunit B [Herbiconiux oxytropis]MCS5724642.1 3-oxoacid CoA-transferase subunit B [Herbiconiux oxytropis]
MKGASCRGVDRRVLAARIAQDIPEGSYVNLGIGAPTLISNYLPGDLDIVLHTENGLLGMGPEPTAAEVDPDLINAGKLPVTELPGAAYFHHADSFGMMRGGHLDICVLGAFQVSQAGDLANWHTGDAGAVPAVGGAMDLAIGAKQVFVMMDLLGRDGTSKLVAECSYPLTAARCVSRVYTDRAIFDVTRYGLAVIEVLGDSSVEHLREVTGLDLIDAVPKHPAATAVGSAS